MRPNLPSIFLIIIFQINLICSKEERTFLDNYVPLWRAFKKVVNSNVEIISSTRNHRKLMILNGKLQDYPANKHFPCNLNLTLRSKKRPKSVHELRPGDIDIVGAIGDSLTAGFGIEANNVISLLHEGRGSSFSIGGFETWRTRLTLPNILKQFNSHVYGYSLNSITVDSDSRFNVAEVGAVSKNMPFMAKILIRRIKSDRNVDLENDWKMITIFIGHNDFCSENCYVNDYEKVLYNHRNDMLKVLRLFRDNLTRTVVNFIPPLHLRILLSMTDKLPFCHISHTFSCPCLIGLPHEYLRPKMMDLMSRWQKLDLEIANYKEFDRDDFAVIAHRFTLNYSLPRLTNGNTDYRYMSPDCFHGSQRGHAQVANALWNSLLEPYENKSTFAGREFAKFLCPSESSPYIFTKRNSKS